MAMTYPVADVLTQNELMTLGCPQYQVRAFPTGEKRVPEAGEWVILQRSNQAYRAPAGLLGEYRIAKLMRGPNPCSQAG
jgi:hypothetical protein